MRLGALYCLVLIVCAARAASAQDAALDLEWSAPAECPQQADVAAEIARCTAQAQPSERAKQLTVVGRIVRLESEYLLQLHASAGAEETDRELRAQRCDELARAAALIAALLVDTNVVEAKPAIPEPPVAEPVPEPAEPGPPDPEPDPEPATPVDTLHPFVDLSAVVDLGTMPALGVGPVLGLGAVFGPFRVELFGLFLPGQRLRSDLRSEPLAVVWLLTGGLDLCYALLQSPAAVSLCAEGEYGRLWGESRNVSDPGTGGTDWLQAGLGARVDFPLGAGFGLGVQLSVGFPLDRTRFSIAGVTASLHEVAPVIGRLRAGLLWQF